MSFRKSELATELVSCSTVRQALLEDNHSVESSKERIDQNLLHFPYLCSPHQQYDSSHPNQRLDFGFCPQF